MEKLSDKAIRALHCMDYHGTKNLWEIHVGSLPGDGDELVKWRVVGAECLAKRAAFDVSAKSLNEALERAFDLFSPSFIAEAEQE